jgi:hypothetical protein
MSDPQSHEIQLLSTSLDQIKEFLGVTGDVPPTHVVADGVVLTNTRISKSAGFDTTQYILEGILTVATSVTSGVLTAWLNDRLKAARKVTATLDDNEVITEPDVRER